MPHQLDDTNSPLARASRDTWRHLRLSSLEGAVALMVVFGVTASIAQPIIWSTNSSLMQSVKQLNPASRRARPVVPKTKTAVPDRRQSNATQRDANSRLVRDSRPQMRDYPADPLAV